ncbi:hypothetical protein M569_11630, partial [Genlisea aurea]
GVMECIEARALKASFLSQMAMKATSQAFYNDDGWCLTGVPSEDFPVEDLLNLDFSDKEFQDAAAGLFKEDQDSSNKGGSNNSSSTFSGADDFDSLSSGNLHVPVEEDLDNLEWLSQFADDSTAAGASLFPIGNFPSRASVKSEAAVDERAFIIPPPVPRKSRSKRERSNGQSWSLTSPQLSSVDSSTASSSSYTSTPPLPILLFLNAAPAAAQEPDWFSTVEKPPAKKPKRKPEPESGGLSGRRCTHCQVQKTPQWRTGPLGPKTLCNACGVRFKSGRLFPEYRPACSPTFSHDVHSNSHRKVLEMRRKKEA